jgi:hypothetical protein
MIYLSVLYLQAYNGGGNEKQGVQIKIGQNMWHVINFYTSNEALTTEESWVVLWNLE